MDLEASLVERLHKLKQWQIEQQERLIRQQMVQRQKLTQDQLNLYKALKLPIQEIGLDDAVLFNSNWYEDAYLNISSAEHLQNYKHENNDENSKEAVQEQPASNNCNINKSGYLYLFNNSSMNSNDDTLQEESFNEVNESSKLIINEHLDTLKYQGENYNGTGKNDCNSYDNHLEMASQRKEIHITDQLLEGIEPLPPDKPIERNFIIDEVPVISSKKDFPTLLEETLKNCKTTHDEKSCEKIPNQIKRPFLRKGQGLARFRMTQTSKNPPMNTKFSNTSLSNKQITNKQIISKNSNNDNGKNKNMSISSKSVPSKKYIAVTDVAQQQLSLKSVPPPQKTCSKRAEATLANIQSNIIELNNSDIDLKTQRELEEVRIFELLEEKAENSSLCSTSSTVVAFLQQSTPFKVRQKIKDTKDDMSNLVQQNIVEKASPRRLQVMGHQPTLINRKSDTNVNSFWESVSKNPIESVENMQVLRKQNTCNVSLKNKESSQISIQNHVEHLYDEMNHDIQTSVCSSEVDVSLHVRFSEFNEYKTISLSNTSSVSSESLSQKDYEDERAWSDCSELPDSSDTEVLLTKHKQSKASEIASENEISLLSTIKHDKMMYHNEINETEENYNFTDAYTNKNMVEDTDKTEIERKQETIFKSELLKNRLLELEKEIDIFRKESTALSLQRKKLQEDHCRLLNEIKEKELIIESNKKRMEDRIQEEKRKLAREKSALESRLRDSQERAHQNKLERQQIHDLKKQLEQLQTEFRNKESRWSTAQARHRSQIRILKLENMKLKEEVEKLQLSKKYNSKSTKRIGSFSNTKALHQINKQLSEESREIVKSDSLSEDDDKLVKTMLSAINSKEEPIENNCEIVDHESKDHGHNNNKSSTTTIPKQYEQCMQNIIRKRNLYENLLKDATSASTQVSNIEAKSSLNESGSEKVDQVKNWNREKNDDTKMHITKNTCLNKSNEIKSTPEIDDLPKIPQKLPLNSNSLQYPKELKTDEQEIQCIKHPNGCIEFWYPNGNVKKVFPDKCITKMLYYNGDVRETQKDGRVKYFYASTRTWHTTMPDGLEILEFPNGQVERRSQNGVVEISFPDGSVQIIQLDGSEKWVLPDGTIAETFANGEKVLILPNGQREVHTENHKRREYPDGTVKLIYPGGIQETRYSNGRIRLKDPDGNLLMDSHP